MITGHKTLIIVAHRLTIVRHCDIIYEIKDGKAIEGTESEDWNNAAVFFAIYRLLATNERSR